VKDFKLIFSKNGRVEGSVEMQVRATDYECADTLGVSLSSNMEGGTYYCQKNSGDLHWEWWCEVVEVAIGGAL
jgi:hypothetical protein